MLPCPRFLNAIAQKRTVQSPIAVLFMPMTLTLVCGVHPDGVETDKCLDFRLDPNTEIKEQWSPFGYSWYGDELIIDRPSRYSQSEQTEILDTHPFFTLCLPKMQTPILIKIMFQFTLIVLNAILLMKMKARLAKPSRRHHFIISCG